VYDVVDRRDIWAAIENRRDPPDTIRLEAEDALAVAQLLKVCSSGGRGRRR
jgi:hypothetical protein